MPSARMTSDEARDLTAFLVTLKNRKKEGAK